MFMLEQLIQRIESECSRGEQRTCEKMRFTKDRILSPKITFEQQLMIKDKVKSGLDYIY